LLEEKSGSHGLQQKSATSSAGSRGLSRDAYWSFCETKCVFLCARSEQQFEKLRQEEKKIVDGRD
jgi:hypothetical protein